MWEGTDRPGCQRHTCGVLQEQRQCEALRRFTNMPTTHSNQPNKWPTVEFGTRLRQALPSPSPTTSSRAFKSIAGITAHRSTRRSSETGIPVTSGSPPLVATLSGLAELGFGGSWGFSTAITRTRTRAGVQSQVFCCKSTCVRP
ncbi:hypothetical protein Vafri_12926, partial [Volvox africanus]